MCKEDFIEDGTVLRVAWQASGDGKRREPLKHRKAGEYRDVPVPSWLWEMVRDMPDGPLIPGNGKLFQRYGTIYFRFMHAAEAAGIPDGFTPHSLRHAFASAMLARGVQITELAHFLGHRDINVTHQVYGHLLPSAAKRAVAALDAEFAEWSGDPAAVAGSRGRGRLITLGNIIEAIRAIALRNRYVARRGFRGTSSEMKTPVHYGQICHHYGQTCRSWRSVSWRRTDGYAMMSSASDPCGT